jgi:tryptophan 2,3-dioxygenase
MSYGDYLSLGTILNAQHPISPEHKELLFIVQHQTSELSMKLMLHELHAAHANIGQGTLPVALKMMARVAAIMNQLVHAWDALATMTPPEYTAIRPYLGASSGFQSHQYCEIEFLLGNKNATHLRVHQHKPDAHAALAQALHRPSIYDQAIMAGSLPSLRYATSTPGIAGTPAWHRCAGAGDAHNRPCTQRRPNALPARRS